MRRPLKVLNAFRISEERETILNFQLPRLTSYGGGSAIHSMASSRLIVDVSFHDCSFWILLRYGIRVLIILVIFTLVIGRNKIEVHYLKGYRRGFILKCWHFLFKLLLFFCGKIGETMLICVINLNFCRVLIL